MRQKLWITLITCLAYCVDKELWKSIGYLKGQVSLVMRRTVIAAFCFAAERSVQAAVKNLPIKGAVTDGIGKEYRSDGVHFSQLGLTTHAERWFAALAAEYKWKADSSNKGINHDKKRPRRGHCSRVVLTVR
jgi:hypothetical protein